MRSRLFIRVVLLIFLPVTLGLSGAGQQKSPPPAPATEEPQRLKLPASVLDAELVVASGPQIRLSDYSGKVLVVNLWAAWCEPCRSQITSLVELHRQFKSEGVEIVGLSTEDPEASASAVRNLVFDFGVYYEIGWAPSQVATTFMGGRDALPQTFVISRSGQVVRRFVGFNPKLTPALIEREIKAALAEKSDLPKTD